MQSNIRTQLKKKGSQCRYRYTGTFEKYGFKYTDRRRNHAIPTLLLLNVKDEKGIEVAEHLWFNLTKGFEALGILQTGDILSFNGRVKQYTKGYQGFRPGIRQTLQKDYKIERPTKVKLEKCICQTPHQLFLKENWQKCNQIYEKYEDDYRRRGIFKPYL
ncbi:hypothetical protein [Lentilactobacillus farraginis]|uniref:Uncharacterized protein n=1 Tax=Lentilactobacillus farraginis DSM 18382 = JCM 14108 TaxID=1423743 RepID=X0PML0_9LACO|nr:hypothetical protein [Lentilactobacillus farraginis]KRM12338.1 hypothetical protein FD41_GL000335 [Lentilactobacillus farraginis DSM 18382 = JCM 14108]GAF38086.1 hypothetical protein JCM14108_3188 [Lentilactobacillus farraginis DSM 18382 = JCM 14108]